MKPRKATIENRVFAYDLLRILCAFLVIVTHTNSCLFKESSPQEGIWWFSILWFYLSKIAVPIFVLISGACLLEKTDSAKKSVARILRMLVVLILFSYFYFLYDAWINYGLWPRAIQLQAFFSMLIQNGLTDSFWYLYFYIGLLLMLPFLQRAVHTLSKQTLWAFVLICFFIDSLYPLIVHYLPQAKITDHLYIPIFSGYLGLFLSGYLLKDQKCSKTFIPIVVLIFCTLLCGVLTRIEYTKKTGIDYWKFLDDRMHPTILTFTAAISVFLLVKQLCSDKRSDSVIAELGSCAFGIYLIQDFIIRISKNKLWNPLSLRIPAIPAMLLWEVSVFLVCLGISWMMRRIPPLKKWL